MSAAPRTSLTLALICQYIELSCLHRHNRSVLDDFIALPDVRTVV